MHAKYQVSIFTGSAILAKVCCVFRVAFPAWLYHLKKLKSVI